MQARQSGVTARQTGNEIRIESIEGTPGMWYTFVSEERIDPLSHIEGHDVRLRPDGMWQARGQLGPTGWDVWEVQSDELVSFEAYMLGDFPPYPGFPTDDPVDPSQYGLEWNGQSVVPDDIVADSDNGNGNGGNGNGGNGNGGNGGNGGDELLTQRNIAIGILLIVLVAAIAA